MVQYLCSGEYDLPRNENEKNDLLVVEQAFVDQSWEELRLILSQVRMANMFGPWVGTVQKLLCFL